MLRLRSLWRNDEGVTAVEFALVSPVFFALMLATIDICSYYFIVGQMQYAVTQAGRMVRTGNTTADDGNVYNVIGSGSGSRDAFRNAVCSYMQAYILTSNCSAKLRVDMRSSTSYSTLTVPSNIDSSPADGEITDGETSYTSGGPSCPVVARIFFKYDSLVPGLGAFFAAVVPKTSYIIATTAFRNEPYASGAAPVCPPSAGGI